MGTLVTFASLSYSEPAKGVGRAPISGSDAKHMSAEAIRLAPGATFSERVPAGSDLYLYALTGDAMLTSAGATQVLAQDSFATLEEGSEFTLANSGAGPVELICVVAPPRASGIALSGYRGEMSVIARPAAPIADIPEQKKRRLYFVDKSAAQSARAHAMIVEYQADTVTTMHQHPNADSMFVPLTGKVRFTFDGAEHVVGRGGATVFPAGNPHELCVAEGKVSFLEFHIPAAFVTVR